MANGDAFLACWYVTLKDVQVGAADGGMDDFDYGISSVLDLWLGLVLELDRVFATVYKGFHNGRLSL